LPRRQRLGGRNADLGRITSDDHPGPAAVLINLQAEPPSFFSRFERLAEIRRTDQTDAAAGRARFRFYRERGYECARIVSPSVIEPDRHAYRPRIARASRRN